MSETTVIANNAISVIPMVDSKGNPIEWTPNKKRAYDRMVAKRWARALRRIPNFKSMKPEQIEAWHNRETWKGLKAGFDSQLGLWVCRPDPSDYLFASGYKLQTSG